MTATLRAATLANFETIARECGLDARTLIEAVDLSPRCLSEPDLRLPAAAVLELAAERAGEPGFGLRLAASRRLSNLGADPVMARYAQRLLEREVGVQSKMSERVRRLIVLLPRGHCRVELIAQRGGDFAGLFGAERFFPLAQTVVQGQCQRLA